MRSTLTIALVAALLGIALGVGLTWAELGPYSQAPAQLADDGAGVNSGPLPKAVVVGSDTFNFGFMEQDTKKSHTFQIRNQGDAPLTLAKGSTTCKCTLSNLKDDRLEPGESAGVELEWSGSPDEHFRHSATIRTNDPSRPYLTLTIEGRVSRSHKIVPSELIFSSPVNVGEGAKGMLRLYSFESDQFDVVKHEFAGGPLAKFFELRTEEMPADQVAEVEGAKAGKILNVSVKPGLPLGPLRQRIRLSLDVPGQPTVEVPIEGSVIGDISIVGPAAWHDEFGLLSLGAIERQQGARSRGMHLLVKGEHRDEVKLKVRSVEPDFLKVDFGEPEPVPGQSVVKIPFTIEVPPNAPPGDHNNTIERPFGKIELDTGHPTTPRLQIYVNFTVGK
ncbi:MAG: DUF1573 domain-containing protein [Pirellulales bacterium]